MTDDKIENWISKSTDLQSGLIKAVQEYSQLKAEQEAETFLEWYETSELASDYNRQNRVKPQMDGSHRNKNRYKELFKLYKESKV